MSVNDWKMLHEQPVVSVFALEIFNWLKKQILIIITLTYSNQMLWLINLLHFIVNCFFLQKFHERFSGLCNKLLFDFNPLFVRKTLHIWRPDYWWWKLINIKQRIYMKAFIPIYYKSIFLLLKESVVINQIIKEQTCPEMIW